MTKKAAKKLTRPPVAQQKATAYGLDAICDDIVAGETLTGIAGKLQMSIGSLLTWIEADSERSARVKESRSRSARLWDEKALTGIEQASDPFELAKARDAAHHLRWRASKIAPRDYGDKVQVGGSDEFPPIRSQVNVNLTAEEAYKAILAGSSM